MTRNSTPGDGNANDDTNEGQGTTGNAQGTQETVIGDGRGDANDHGTPFRGRAQEQHMRSHSRSPLTTGESKKSRRRHRHRHDERQRSRRHRTPFRGGDGRLPRHQRDNAEIRRNTLRSGDKGRSQQGRNDELQDDTDDSASFSGSDSDYSTQTASESSEDPPWKRRKGGNTPTRRHASYRKAPLVQSKNVADRISVLVKGTIFRKLKFITSEAMFNKAMKIVLDTEEPDDEEEFIRIYKTTVVGGINAKRSSCEQAGSRIVKDLLDEVGFDESDNEPPIATDTLMMLRQGTTTLDKAAFFWFIGEFLSCVSGKKVWGRKRYYYRVSEAVIDKGSKELVVTVSDEAFAILLYENYIDKWISRYHAEKRGEKPKGKMTGKYTSTIADSCLYGGWSVEGVARFNELCAIVDKDRKTDYAKKAEDEVLLKLRQRKFGDSVDTNGNLIDPREERQRNRVMAETIEAFCEL